MVLYILRYKNKELDPMNCTEVCNLLKIKKSQFYNFMRTNESSTSKLKCTSRKLKHLKGLSIRKQLQHERKVYEEIKPPILLDEIFGS